jgi:predicted RNA-binding protein with TRAM domain
MNQDRDFRSNIAPVKVGDEVNVKIEAVGGKGDGIAKKEGFVLFVPNTKEGDEVKIRITRVLNNVGFAEVVGQAEKGEQEAAVQDEPEAAQPEETEQEVQEEVQDSEDFGEDLEEKKE